MELREVVLRESSSRWPWGTAGVVVDAYEDDATIELFGEAGETLDIVTLPYSSFALLEDSSQEHLPI